MIAVMIGYTLGSVATWYAALAGAYWGGKSEKRKEEEEEVERMRDEIKNREKVEWRNERKGELLGWHEWI